MSFEQWIRYIRRHHPAFLNKRRDGISDVVSDWLMNHEKDFMTTVTKSNRSMVGGADGRLMLLRDANENIKNNHDLIMLMLL